MIQKELIDKFNSYLELHKSEPGYNSIEVHDIIKDISQGICRGIVLTEAAVKYLNIEESWLALLNSVIHWDGRKESLSKEVDNKLLKEWKRKPSDLERKEKNLKDGELIAENTLDSAFKLTMSILRFNQDPLVAYNNKNLTESLLERQLDLTSPLLNLFDLDIKDRLICAGNMSRELFCQLITHGKNSDVILLNLLSHSCRVWFNNVEKKYYFSEPNSGVSAYDSAEQLYEWATKFMSLSAFSLEFISFTEGTNYKDIENIYNDKLSIDMLDSLGLVTIIEHSPNKLQTVINKLRMDAERDKIISLLCLPDQDGAIGWLELMIFAPGYTSQFLSMVNTDEQKCQVILSLCITNNINMKAGWMTVFSSIVPEDIKLLLINILNSQMSLHLVAKNGYKDIVELLVNLLNFDLNAIDKNGKTALHYAAENGHDDVVSFLLEKRVNSNIKDKNGHTALQCAQNSRKASTFMILFKHSRSNSNRMPEHIMLSGKNQSSGNTYG
ncbi:ankyrin repeat domain-containing protein [Thiotrichales bacterium 19S9-12]|nr:ankyrin repeat domain-containing protein [Thiotrichales bacterium 19S9-11]MCF6812378.1 ankyrin repeat domain-containing protein [Thiotrichales bacterium 19S9-12]